MDKQSGYHVPVLLEQCMDCLQIRPGGVYVDGTLGGAGHTRAMLQRGAGRVYGIDRDADAIANAQQVMQPYGERFRALRGNYRDMRQLLTEAGVDRVDGVLMDLGVSSHQLDVAERGFSFHSDAPLDMRMDQSQPLSAWNVVNEYKVSDLARVIAEYGEERWAKRIAEFVEKARPIHTTAQLVAVIDAAIPKAVRQKMSHPARRTFQAIRIEVNGELADLEPSLYGAMECLKPGGHLAVITFHSLEDRIVKKTFLKMKNPCTCPPSAPICVCGKKPIGQNSAGPILPTEEELEENTRSHSAKLRAIEHI